MSANKVVYNGKTLIDLTGDTVTENTLVSGATAHDMTGKKITGKAVIKSEQKKSFEATANGSYTVTPDSGKTLSSVDITVNVTNADTVDGIHLVVATTEATNDDKTVITFIY